MAFNQSLPITAWQWAQYFLRKEIYFCVTGLLTYCKRRMAWPCFSPAGVLYRQQSFQERTFSIPNNTIVCDYNLRCSPISSSSKNQLLPHRHQFIRQTAFASCFMAKHPFKVSPKAYGSTDWYTFCLPALVVKSKGKYGKNTLQRISIYLINCRKDVNVVTPKTSQGTLTFFMASWICLFLRLSPLAPF